MASEHTSIYMGVPNTTMFDTKSIRSAFVSKVYTILFFQLLIATTLIAVATFHEPAKTHLKENGAPYLYASMGIGLVVVLALTCIDSARRSFPLNFILLLVLTLAYGMIAAVFSARFNSATVLSAFAATAFATLAVMLMAKYSPFDMTTCGCGLFVLSLLHLFAVIILVLVVPKEYAQTGSLILAVLGAFLVSLYMMFDLQLIMGGRSGELSEEEYVLGAALLYIDIIQLFQYMLIIFGRSD